MSRFSADSDSDENGRRSKGKDSLFSYLSQLSIPRKERALRSSSNLTQQSSNRTSTGTSSFRKSYQREGGTTTTTTTKDRSYWSRISLTSLLRHSARESSSTGGRFILPNRARRRSSGPHDTPHLLSGREDGDSSAQSLTGGALASIQRGTSKLRSGMDKARNKVTEARTERRKIELKRKIRVIGEADQFPDGRVNWWI